MARTLELKARSAERFFNVKRFDGSNHRISQTLDFSSLLFSQALRGNDDFALELPYWPAERAKQLGAICQIKTLSKFSIVTSRKLLKTINEMFCNHEFRCQNEWNMRSSNPFYDTCATIKDSDESVQSGQCRCEQRFFQAGHYQPARETTS